MFFRAIFIVFIVVAAISTEPLRAESPNQTSKVRFGKIITSVSGGYGGTWYNDASEVTWFSAMDYCIKQGGRLPTARELAIFTVGADRIKEASQFTDEAEARKVGYLAVDGVNFEGHLDKLPFEGKSDPFYVKFEQPTSIKLDSWLWTSSFDPRYDRLVIALWNNNSGNSRYQHRDVDENSFRCVFDR